MAILNLRDFFNTGQFGEVKIGMSRQGLHDLLGSPDDSLNPKLAYSTPPWEEVNAPVWWYGGIEFAFDCETSVPYETHILQYIQFKPYYLYLWKWPTHIQRWVFRSRQGPTRQRLSAALTRAGIAYQDTGLETVLWNENTKQFMLTDYNPLYAKNDPYAESFGTLVMKSGVQVRYEEDDSIIQVILGSSWMFPGKERFIQW